MPTSVTIASGQSLSPAFNLGGASIGAIIVPSTWDAANITLQVSLDGSMFYNLYDDQDNEIVLQAAASRAILIDNFAQLLVLGEGVTYKLRSGTASVAVAQTGDVVLSVIPVR